MESGEWRPLVVVVVVVVVECGMLDLIEDQRPRQSHRGSGMKGQEMTLCHDVEA